MEGEPCDVQSDVSKAPPEKKHKRYVKTPSQIEALEKFYNEHKYPTESMKLQLAESIGLTEKQISGWFCHRRLKDKRLPNDEAHATAKQDRSSGVIQDRGSGLKQDSCGSTKQGDNRQCDPKEVESRRFTAQGVSPVGLRYDIVGHHSSGTDDTSSGSSLPFQDSFHIQNAGFGPATSRHSIQDGNIARTNVKAVQSRHGPSGYLKIKGQVENAAIVAVKRQLGRNYRGDGPPLGIEFDPLPPGAFETPMGDQANEPYYPGDSSPLRSLDGARSYRLPYAGKVPEASPENYHVSEYDDTSFRSLHGSKHRDKYADHQLWQTSSRSANHFPRNDSHIDMNGNSARKTSLYNSMENIEVSAKCGVEETRLESLPSHHLSPYGRKINSKQADYLLCNDNNLMPKFSAREQIEYQPSTLMHNRSESLDLESRRLSRKMSKEGKLCEESGGMFRSPEPVLSMVRPSNDMRLGKRVGSEFSRPHDGRKETMGEVTPWRNYNKRPAPEMISSFSEDETAETSSSGE